ncbi:MAG: AFG1 family ATPase [Gammaproteobacteria bacterium]|nr:AFG1 family ATPase [Gammaproteobacteria bacterium]MCH9763969.1 AFG1 family ATPase [Gammaproteobacteria bacterium]
MKSLLAYYEAAIAAGDIVDSFNQRQVLSKLQDITKAVDASHSPRHWWSRCARRPQGLYLHGPVGVGKTYLMNLFYQHLPERHKERFHFHHFMQHVDEALRTHQGHLNPLREIAKRIACDAHVLCLDEFLVEDVADASILAGLLEALFVEGIILVVTANTKPDDLYEDGLHRERFLPAIALLKQHCDVDCLDDQRDYRMGRDIAPEAYFFPENEAHEAEMLAQFKLFSVGTELKEAGELTVQQRSIAYVREAGRAVWFDFDVICNLPRSQLDYLELATRFNAIFVSHVPAIGEDEPGRAVLFIRFVDVMYDAGIRLVLLAAVPTEMIYLKGPMAKMFERTLSRLREMQSPDYLNKARVKIG